MKSLDTVFHPRQFDEIIERSPETAVAWLQLAVDVGIERVRHLSPQLLESIFQPGYFLELVERSPDSAAVLLRLMANWNGEFIQALEPDAIQVLFQPHTLESTSRRSPTALAGLLRLARTLNLGPAARTIVDYLAQSEGILEKLPIEAIRDVRWLLDTNGSPGLEKALASALGN